MEPPSPPSRPPDGDPPADAENELVPFAFTDVLDLHTFAARDVPDLIADYLDHAVAAGWRQVRIIHGKGGGILRRRVQGLLDRHPAVDTHRTAPEGAGGWGATLVELRGPAPDG